MVIIPDYVREIVSPDGAIFQEWMMVLPPRMGGVVEETMFFLFDHKDRQVGKKTFSRYLGGGSVFNVQDTMPTWWKAPANPREWVDIFDGYVALGMQRHTPIPLDI